MDPQQIMTAYIHQMPLDNILSWYTQCDLTAKTSGYCELGLLHIACQYAHHEALDYLLKQGLNPNEPAGSGKFPLFILAGANSGSNYTPRPGDIRKCTELLLAARASTLHRDDDERLCYHIAASDANYEFLEALFDRGVKMTRADGSGNTGLHIIVEATYNPQRDLEAAQKRLRDKMNEDNLPKKQRTNLPIEQLEEQVKRHEDKLEALFKCAVVFMRAGVDPDLENNMLESAKKAAVRRGCKKISALLEGVISPDEADDPGAAARIATGGMTLHQAVRQHDTEAIGALVDAGADINEISDDEGFVGMTPLAEACTTSNVKIAELLLRLGADPLLKSGDGRPAIAYLFTNRININPPQHIFREKTPGRLVRLMVEHGYDINSSATDQGDTLLGLACGSSHGGGPGRDNVKYMVVDEALRFGADPNLANIHGQTPLMFICQGDFSWVESIEILLLEAGADVNAKDKDGNTPLHYAARYASQRSAFALSELLFEVDSPDVNAVNNTGKTPLDYATERGNEQLAKMLLENM